jgi:hypothetical protein
VTQSHAGPPRAPATNITPIDKHEPALKDVLVELWQNVEKLMRQELAHASAELDVKAQRLKREAAAFGAGAGMILAGVLALVLASFCSCRSPYRLGLRPSSWALR